MVGSLSSHALTPLEFQAPTGSTQVRVEVVRSPQASHTSQPPAAGVDVTLQVVSGGECEMKVKRDGDDVNRLKSDIASQVYM